MNWVSKRHRNFNKKTSDEFLALSIDLTLVVIQPLGFENLTQS